jgi:hypothetical protein
MNTCPHCNALNAQTRHYCRNCGRLIVTFCCHCGFANEIEAQYCGGCGDPVAATDLSLDRSSKMGTTTVTPSTIGRLTSEEQEELQRINRHRRETIAIGGSRTILTQEDLDRLFGKETK